MTEIPHFALPFQFTGNVADKNVTAATNEQSSEEDIAACVFAIVASEPGQFLYEPDFGLEDLTFEQEPIDLRRIENPIRRWEPRATVLAETNAAKLAEAIDEAIVQIGV